MGHDNGQPQIFTSCYYKKSISGENIFMQHAFAYQISGSLIVRDGRETVIFQPGDFRLNIRNMLAKFVKQPEEEKAFRSLSISFDEETLKEVAELYGFTATAKVYTTPSIQLKKHKLYSNFIQSLEPYLPFPNTDNDELIKLKLKEVLLILLKVQPELKDILFDFADPDKINLKAFMEQNFRFNLSLSRFAYLTGRSLSGFKRDFEKIYSMTPAKWLQQKRLDEAYYLLKEKRQKITEVYIEIGFEDLSHFSYVFKKHFGFPPSKLSKE
ncbi:AraC-like DNA-binding protein [Pedobacter sp. AK017]|uniref:helix-turn-helix domain-containing protein n=1 Tax=Pedobacter sp. AK017 TaxID=2723073 RepID=UPI00161D7962|nr:AraC family transcriptional regulator [Pedobacter sp. AK017]MBB5440469.1 AraC-like DNA-binding protein [Pedobacter sp. AK017]